MTMPRRCSTLDGQLEGAAGNVLRKHNPGFDTAGEEDVVLGKKDSINSSICGKAQGDETTTKKEDQSRTDDIPRRLEPNIE